MGFESKFMLMCGILWLLLGAMSLALTRRSPESKRAMPPAIRGRYLAARFFGYLLVPVGTALIVAGLVSLAL